MRVFACIGILGCVAAATAWAQSTAQIHGTVQDPSGAAVPGAEIKATQTDTGVTRSIVSEADGGFVLTNLPLGPYRLEIGKAGFATAVNTGVVLEVGSDPALTIALKVGATSEQVNVEANAALVETRSLGVGEVIQTQRIVDLPLNGRNVTDLIGLAGASVQTGNTQTRWFSNLPIISIGGSPAVGGAGGTSLFGTEYSLDGANHLNFLSGGTMPIAFPDAVQEFRTETSGQSAQRGAATSVSIVTRSGTNDFHGDLFEFLRNDGFGSAREYFSPVASTYKRNQFGGTIGGRIQRDKL
ncbi:MAG: TonB-dependent receptor, partial [Terriglobia bacterium]